MLPHRLGHRLRLSVAGIVGVLSPACGGGGGASVPAPQADFSVDVRAGVAPLRVSFLDASAGEVSAWSWDFGDGETSGEPSPTHEYARAGSFDVTLTVRGRGGESHLRRPAWIGVDRPPARLEYGMNPSFARSSSREIVFADAMMRASEFRVVRGGELTAEAAPVLPLGETPRRPGEGWPDLAALARDETAGAWLFGPMDGTLPDGRREPWVVTWEGRGEVELMGTAVASGVYRGFARSEWRVDPELGGGRGTVALWIRSSLPANPVRNVRVWLPGTSERRPLFWPPYLERARAMNRGRGPHSWRTLDWSGVNEHGATDGPFPFVFDLAGMIRPASPSQGTRRGMCPEFQVAFCNQVGADLHTLVPHRTDQMSASDYERFLRSVFTRIRDGSPGLRDLEGGAPFAGLDAHLALTVELSNELWNGGFPAARWMALEAARRGLSVHEVIAAELLTVWRIADEVFAGRRSVRRFVGGFVAQAEFARRILSALPPGTRVDALGPSCYFRPRPESIALWMEGAAPGSCPNCPTPEEVLDAAWLSFAELGEHLRAHRAVADGHLNPDGSHPRLELYECGQAFDARGQPWGAVAREAQSLPGMYAAYVDGLIPMLVEAGVERVHWYSFMTDPDPSHGVDVGYGIWDHMQQTLTLPVPDPYLDEGAPKAAAIYRGPP
jgi:PKD repeat protein